MAMFLLLGACFLDRLLKLVQFLAQLRERLRSGLGFFLPFLAAQKLDLFHSAFLKPTTISGIVHRACAPMLLAKIAMFLGASFLRNSGHSASTRLLCTLSLAVQSFLVRRIIGSFLATCALNSLET